MAQPGRVVIIGGGITGCSVAFHLARALWKRAVAGFDSPEFDGLLERAVWHDRRDGQ